MATHPVVDPATLRHYGLELIQLAANLEAEARHNPTGTHDRDELGRLRCCGAGLDQRDQRTGEDIHMPNCRAVAGPGLAACRAQLHGTRR